MKTRKTSVALLVIFLVVVATVHAQRKPVPKPSPKAVPTPSPKPVMTLGATTDDGKRVVLKSDGTWDYDATSRAPVGTPAPVGTKATLRFKAAVITRGGNIIPAARGSFSLLDKDVKLILASTATKIMLVDLGLREKGISVQRTTPYMRSADLNYDLIRPHIVTKTTSDFEGSGVFGDIPPKTYWVYFYGAVGVNEVLWSFKVDLKPGDNYVLLDQNNALETN